MRSALRQGIAVRPCHSSLRHGADGLSPAPGEERGESKGQRPPEEQPQDHAREAPDQDVAAARAGVLQVAAAVLEAGEVPDQGPVGLGDGLLDEEMGREGGGVGLLLALAQGTQHHIQEAQDLGGVLGLGPRAADPPAAAGNGPCPGARSGHRRSGSPGSPCPPGSAAPAARGPADARGGGRAGRIRPRGRGE